MLNFVGERILQGNERLWNDWTKVTAATVIQKIQEDCQLLPYKDNSRDKEGYLGIALLCRILPYRKQSDHRLNKAAAEFKAVFCFEALHCLLLSTPGDRPGSRTLQWENHMRSRLSEYQGLDIAKTNSALSWKLLGSCLTALSNIRDRNTERETPRCHSALEIALLTCWNFGLGCCAEEQRKDSGELQNLLDLIWDQCKHLLEPANCALDISNPDAMEFRIVQRRLVFLLGGRYTLEADLED